MTEPRFLTTEELGGDRGTYVYTDSLTYPGDFSMRNNLKYVLVVVVVLFIAIYGFEVRLPTAAGTLELNSGFKANGES